MSVLSPLTAFTSARTLEAEVAAAERTNRDAARELQTIETSVDISKRNLRDLAAQATGKAGARERSEMFR